MTTTGTATDISDTFTDAQWDAADRIVAALEAKQDLTLAKVLKAAQLERRDHGLAVVAYLIEHKEIAASGNGTWTHYHPRG